MHAVMVMAVDAVGVKEKKKKGREKQKTKKKTKKLTSRCWQTTCAVVVMIDAVVVTVNVDVWW